jgi:hypothetical protein
MFNYVTAYLSLIILIVAFNTKFLNAQSVQVSNKSITRQFTWVYDLPRSYPRGPLDVTVKGEYYYTKERLGDRYFVRLHCRMISLEFNAVHGTLRYKYNGKEYRQDQLDATDQKGSYGFDQIRIIKIAANIDVSFLENSKTVSIGDGIAKEVGDIDKDADLNKLNLELAGSRLTYLNWDGSIGLEQRILNLSKPKVTTPNYNSNNSNTYNSSSSSNNSTGNNSSNNAKNSTDNNSSNKSSSTNGTSSSSSAISSNTNSSSNTKKDESSAQKKLLLATYKDDNGKWIAMGPYMTTDPYETENQALGSLFYSESDFTFICQRGKFKIYALNGKVEHDARDIRLELKALGIYDIPE